MHHRTTRLQSNIQKCTYAVLSECINYSVVLTGRGTAKKTKKNM